MLAHDITSSEPASASEDASENELDPAAFRQLRRELERERYKNTQLQANLKRQAKLNEQLQQTAEQEEEYITNKLMKRLSVLKHEKEHLARQVEMEEEMITNKLSKKLEKVKQEKVNLENLLEQEQEYIVNKLQKQLSVVFEEKRALETQLRESTGTILQTLQLHLDRWREKSTQPGQAADALALQPLSVSGSAAILPSAHQSELDGDAESEVQQTHLLMTHLAAEIDALGGQQERYRADCEALSKKNEQLKEELGRLQADNSGLQHRIAREREIREAAQGDKARLETELELDSERAFNSGVSSVCSSPALTASLAPLSPRSLALSSSSENIMLPPTFAPGVRPSSPFLPTMRTPTKEVREVRSPSQ